MRKRTRQELLDSGDPRVIMQDLTKIILATQRLLTADDAPAASSSSSSYTFESPLSSSPSTPIDIHAMSRQRSKRTRQVQSIIQMIDKIITAHFFTINIAAPIHMSVLDHAFVARCFCVVFVHSDTMPNEFRGEEVRAVFELMQLQLEPFEAPRFPDDLLIRASQMIVGVFESQEPPVVLLPEKHPWQPPLLPASHLAKADAEQRTRIHNANAALGAYSSLNHFIPDEEDPRARLPPIEMRKRIDAISFACIASRLWFWTLYRKQLLDAAPSRILAVEGRSAFFEEASTRLLGIIDENARIEFQPATELFVRNVALHRLCPIGSVASQMRVQNCMRAGVLSASSVFQGERGFNQYNRYAELLKLTYSKYQLELRAKRGQPNLTASDGTEIIPPGVSRSVDLDTMSIITDAWNLAILHRWISQNTRWIHNGHPKNLDFTKEFIVFEHQLSDCSKLLTTPKRHLHMRRPLIIEIKHDFFVHYFPVVKRPVAYGRKGYVLSPDPRRTKHVLIKGRDFLDAFCKWCFVMRELFDARTERDLDMTRYFTEILPQ